MRATAITLLLILTYISGFARTTINQTGKSRIELVDSSNVPFQQINLIGNVQSNKKFTKSE